MYHANIYNETYKLKFKGCFESFDEAINEFQKAKSEYMTRFKYEFDTTEYNQELKKYIIYSRIDKS